MTSQWTRLPVISSRMSGLGLCLHRLSVLLSSLSPLSGVFKLGVGGRLHKTMRWLRWIVWQPRWPSLSRKLRHRVHTVRSLLVSQMLQSRTHQTDNPSLLANNPVPSCRRHAWVYRLDQAKAFQAQKGPDRNVLALMQRKQRPRQQRWKQSHKL